MRKLIFIALAVASYWMAGSYRQMPLMILAVMEWILFAFLFFLSRRLRTNLTVSFALQSDEAERGSSRKCLVHIGRSGGFLLKKVCVELKVYDDRGSLVHKIKRKATVDALTGVVEFDICFAHCGILRVQICKVRLFDYLSIFSSTEIVCEEMEFVVLPKARTLLMQPVSLESMAVLLKKSPDQPDQHYIGEDNSEIRQIREYHTGDTMRYIHWNQSAKTGKLWFKEFERDDEAPCEILVDMMFSESWKPEEQDGFYEVVSAVLAGFLQLGYSVSVCWYDEKTAGFMTAMVADHMDFRSMIRKLYQSGFVKKTDVIEMAYAKRQASAHQKMFKCNLRLEWYEINGSGGEELRHRFTYGNLEQELSGDSIFSLW